MEKGLERCLDEALSVQGVVGVLCADEKGLCFQNKGKTSSVSGGVVVELANTAAKIEPASAEKPIVILESDTTNVMIRTVGNVTTCIYKLAPK